MRQRKVFQLLRLFDLMDVKGFQAYLANPYFNQSKTLIEFFVRCRKRVLDLPEEAACTVDDFLAGSNMSRRRMDKMCSRLYALACNYLALKSFEQDGQVQDDMLFKAIEQRDVEGKETLRMNARLRGLNDAQKEGPETILRALELRWRHAEMAIKTRETRQLWQENFHHLHELLDRYYALQKLKLLSATANIRKIFKHEAGDPGHVFWETLRHSGTDIGLPTLARGYFLCIRMMEGEAGETWFQELLQLLGENAAAFREPEAMELYGYALNFCICNSNQGKLEYLQHASALYRQLLDNKLILEKGELWPQQFKNIVALHCRLGEVDWVSQFIAEYAPFLPVQSRKNDLMYNEAILSFYRGAYAPAIRQFKDIIAHLTDDVFYGIDARVYLWKSYFEMYADLSMAEVDDMHRLYDSFRLFIERNDKIAVAHKQHYRNFIREFKRFMEILRLKPIAVDSLQRL
ncbi:MAG TPA: hypothetical protein ENJ82_03905, partial [Bacteroidetes bacterium]|nr:hypothetical protein [Bacteroidota bacterium]